MSATIRSASGVDAPRPRSPVRILIPDRVSHAGAGFSLIELLLTLVIILLLFGAMAFSLSPWQQSASLQEGADRFASVLQLARAQAAETGRTVLVQFSSNTNDVAGLALASTELLWEPDPLSQPGTFQRLAVPGWDMEDINSLVGVAKVSELSTRARTNAAPVPEALAGSWPPLHFFSDGSSDSAEIQLASREDPGGLRHIVVRLMGLTGAVTSHWVDVDSAGAVIPEDGPEAIDDWEELDDPTSSGAPPKAAGQTF